MKGKIAGIAYEDVGSGPPLVLIHGLTYDRRIWEPFWTALAPDLRCIAIDLPGHGESADLPNIRDHDPDSFADRLHRVLIALDAVPPTIAGHSIGGAQAAWYASRHPTKAAIDFDQSFRLGVLAGIVQQAEPSLRGAGFADFWANLRNSFGVQHIPEPYRRLEQINSRPRRKIVLAYWDILLRNKPEDMQRLTDDMLRGIKCPFIAYHGEDPGADYAAWLTRLVPSARLICRRGSGHFPHLVHFEEAAALIRTAALAD